MPSTVLRSATIKPVTYSAKCRRWHSLAKMSPYWAKASCTTWGNSTIPGMSRCSALRLRQPEYGPNRLHLPYFYRVVREFAKLQLYLRFRCAGDALETMKDGLRAINRAFEREGPGRSP